MDRQLGAVKLINPASSTAAATTTGGSRDEESMRYKSTTATGHRARNHDLEPG